MAICVFTGYAGTEPYIVTEPKADEIFDETNGEFEVLTEGEEFEAAKKWLHLTDFETDRILKSENYYVCLFLDLYDSGDYRPRYSIVFNDDESSDEYGTSFYGVNEAIECAAIANGTNTSYFPDYIGGTVEIYDNVKQEALFYMDIISKEQK